MDVGAQLGRAQAEEHPLHFIGQRLDDVGDHLQIAGMTGTPGPAYAWFARLPAQGNQPAPDVRLQRIGHYPDITVQPREGLGQWLSGHHEPVYIGQTSAQGTQNVLGHVRSVDTLEREVGQVVVQLEHLERLGERMHTTHVFDLLVSDLALQHDAVRSAALQFGR